MITLSTMFRLRLSLIFTQAFLLHYCHTYEVQDIDDAMQYLSRFGYVGPDTATSMNLVDASELIRQFQRMAGVNQSGELDAETVHMMNAPRCGNKDMDHEIIPDADDEEAIRTNSVSRKKRYRLNEYHAKWRKRELTYRVSEYSPKTKIAPELVEKDVEDAFRMWERSTNLNFVKSNDKNVDIELHFTGMRHHDDFPFDGPGKTLAHAFPPGAGLGGDVHFDDSEMWSTNSPRGTNVLFVAVHEIGHALGLSHSDAKGSIMQAFYGGYRPHLKLHDDDVAGIQAIYGKREIPLNESPSTRVLSNTNQGRQQQSGGSGRGMSSTVNRLIPLIGRWNKIIPLPEPKRDRLMHMSSVQSAASVQPPPPAPAPAPAPAPDGENNPTIIIAENPTIVTAPTPKPPPPTTTTEKPAIIATTTTTTTLPTNHPSTPGFHRPELCQDSKIDAITTLKDGNVYVFKGFYVFRLDLQNGRIEPGWPSRIEYKFDGLEGNIDAALTRPNGKTFFFKAGKYWRFDGFRMDGDYPKAISKHFPGIPDHVDSAFENPESGQMYFTKGDKMWRFDPKASSGQHVNDAVYPISITTWNLPESGIDEAFVSPTGTTYIFKDDNVWKFDLKAFKISESKPESAKEKWFGCSSSSAGAAADGSSTNRLRESRQSNNYNYNSNENDINKFHNYYYGTN